MYKDMTHTIVDRKELRYFLATKGIKFEIKGKDLIIHDITTDKLIELSIEEKSTNDLKALEEKIFNSFMANPDNGLGEVNDCRDEAKRIVTEWIEETTKPKAFEIKSMLLSIRNI